MTVNEFRAWVQNVSTGVDTLTISAARKEDTFRALLAALLSRETVDVPKS